MISKLTKKEVMAFGKGLLSCVRGLSKQGIKAMDFVIVDPKTGKQYVVAICEK